MKNKNIKHLLTLFMYLVSFTASAYDFEVDGIYYTVTSFTDFTCAVTYGEKEYEGTLIIPPTVVYNNRTLTVVGINGFSSDNAIRSLTIPYTVSSVSNNALYNCTSLDSLIIQDGDTEIDLGRSSHYEYEYEHRWGISSSYDLYLYYYQGPLYHTPTSYVYVGRNIKKVRHDTSYWSSGNQHQYYYYDQFYNSSLKVAEIGSKVTSMPFFYESEQLEKVIFSKESAIEIGDSIFMRCSKLSEISANDKVKRIGNRVFFRCNSLKNVPFPNAEIIGEYAFYGCSALESVPLPSAQTIGSSAFGSCDVLECISIPNVQAIGDYAFSYCRSLETIALPQSVESISGCAFWGTKITDIVIPNRVKVLNNIFPNCIKSITLGDSIESIGSSTFKCDSLETINILTATPPSLHKDACGNVQYMNVNVNVPIGTKEAYMQADYWKNFWNINEIDPTGIESITETSAELVFSSTSDGIALSGANGQSVRVYSITGEEVLSIKNYQGQSFSLPKGICVIKAGKKALKVQL